MSIASTVDVSPLEFPDFAKGVDEDQVVERLALICKDHAPNVSFDQGSIPSSILRLFAKREIGLRRRVNEAARALILATSEGDDLDNVAAGYGVRRMRIEDGDESSSPPKDAVFESDERLRFRARLALEALSQTGTQGAYLFAALSAHGHLKDVRVYSGVHAPVEVRLLTVHGDGGGGETPGNADVKRAVEDALMQVVSLTDRVNVEWAQIETYAIDATITLDPQMHASVGGESMASAILDAVRGLVAWNHRLGRNIWRHQFFSAMSRAGVAKVDLREPSVDRSIDLDTAPWVDPETIRVSHLPGEGNDRRFVLSTARPGDGNGSAG